MCLDSWPVGSCQVTSAFFSCSVSDISDMQEETTKTASETWKGNRNGQWKNRCPVHEAASVV